MANLGTTGPNVGDTSKGDTRTNRALHFCHSSCLVKWGELKYKLVYKYTIMSAHPSVCLSVCLSRRWC